MAISGRDFFGSTSATSWRHWSRWFGKCAFITHHFQWHRSEVAIIYPENWFFWGVEHDRTDWIAKLWALKPVALVYFSDIIMKMKPHWQRVCSRYLRVAFCSSCCQWPSQSANVHYRRQKIIRKHRNEIPRLWLICSRSNMIPSDHRFSLHEQIQWTWA